RLPESTIGRTVQLVVTGMAIDWGPQVSLRTAPLHIPSDSRLEFATGVLEPGWMQGSMLFVVEACDDHACKTVYESSVNPIRESDRGWREASVALDAFADKTVSFVFRSTLSPVSSETFSLPVWANP